jgi:hypothetical protein
MAPTLRPFDTTAALQHAQLSHVSRLRSLGLDVGEQRPVHLTVDHDQQVAIDDVVLHHTDVLPPLDADGVTPASAFVQYCATATVLEAIVAGDWLLHRRHVSVEEVADLAARDDWRPGARQARVVLGDLTGRSRSPRESELRAVVAHAGLPVPEAWYEDLRVTEVGRRPRACAVRVHQLLVRRGHDVPGPVFGRRWAALFEPIRVRPHLVAATCSVGPIGRAATRRG